MSAMLQQMSGNAVLIQS